MNQISQATDKKLNELSHKIGAADKKITEAQKEKDAAWVDVVDTFGEHNAPARFIADDGFYLQHQERNGTPKLDEGMLSEKLKAIMTPAAFTRLWNSITVKSVSPVLVEQAQRGGKIPAAILQECLTVPPTTFARVRMAWTKEDKEKVQIFGIQPYVAPEAEPTVEISVAEYERLKALDK